MKLLTHIVLITISLIFITCSTAPEFERGNENDPSNESYSPNQPTGANFSISSDTLITITWEDQTTFETGYRIYKRVGNNFNELITTLPPNTTEYIDSTKEFGFPTSYIVTAIKDSSESDSLYINIDFGTVDNFNYAFGISVRNQPSVNFSWQDRVSFEDGFILTKETDSNFEQNSIKEINHDETRTSIDLPNDGFVHEFKIIPFKIFKGDTTTLPVENSRIIVIRPENLEMNLITEDSLTFTWDFNSTFHDSYLLEVETSSGSKSFEIDRNENEFSLYENIEKNFPYNASISAVKGELLSPTISVSEQFNLEKILIDSIAHISETELSLRINNRSETKLTKHVYRKTENTEFVKIGEIPKNHDLFYDTNLEKTETYTYYVDTNLSDRSASVIIKNRKGLRKVHTVQLQKNQYPLLHNEINRNKISHSITVLDRDTDQLLLLDYITNNTKSVFESDFYIYEFVLHQNPNIIAALELTETNIRLHVFENNTNTLIESVNLGLAYIRNIDFSSDKVFYLKKQNDTDWQLISSSLDGNEKNTLISFISENDTPSFAINSEKNRLVLLKFKNHNEIEIQHFKISGSNLELQKTTIVNNYPINFSPNLDSMIVSKRQYNLSLVDLHTTNTLFSQEFTLYNSNNLGKSFFFDDGLLFAPDQAGAYIVDTRNQLNPILQTIGYTCCSISFVGAFWDKETNHLVDIRRSHISGIPDFYTVYSIESFWRVFNSEN